MVPDENANERMRRAMILRSFAEVHRLSAALEEAGIPVLFRPFNDPAFGSFWRTVDGWGEVLARAQDVDAVLRISRDLCAPAEPLGDSDDG